MIRGSTVFVRDKAAKNGTFVGDSRVSDDREVLWRPAIMVRIGRTVLALEEPIRSALADLERADDEPIPSGSAPTNQHDAPALAAGSGASVEMAAAPLASVPPPTKQAPKQRVRWSLADLLVMAAALSVLVLSLAGLVWLLRG